MGQETDASNSSPSPLPLAIRANLERKYALVQALQGQAAEMSGAKVLSLAFDPYYGARHGGRISN